MEAVHGAAHALAFLHFRIPFGSVGVDDEGHCKVFSPSRIMDEEIKAKVAMVGPCVNLAIDLIEASNKIQTLANILFGWRDDVLGEGRGHFDDLIDTGSFIPDVTPWALAFVNENQALLELLATKLVKTSGVLAYSDCQIIGLRNVVGVSSAALEEADLTLAGNLHPLEQVADAIGQIERAEIYL